MSILPGAVSAQSSVRTITPSSSAGILREVGSLDLPGPKGLRFDYLSMDTSSHSLFITHLGAGNLYVVDTKTMKVLHTIPGLPGVEGIEIAPDLQKAYASDWWENKVAVIDLRSWKVVKKIGTEAKPDGIVYAAPFHEIFVSDERGRAVAVIDARTDTLVKSLHFKSETGNLRFDPVSQRVLVNLQETNSIGVIDPRTGQIEQEWPLLRCRGNHGMALDPERRLAFLVCEDNDRLVVFHLDQKKELAAYPLPSGGDVVAWDAAMQRLYVACFSGSIAVFHLSRQGQFAPLGIFTTEPKVHSLALDPDTHRVYVPEQEFQGHAASRLAVLAAVP